MLRVMERVVSTIIESLMVSVKEKDSLTVKVSITVSVMAHLHPLCHFASNHPRQLSYSHFKYQSFNCVN